MAEDVSVLELKQDGCYVDRHGIQHYLFPRELEQIKDSVELARYEFAWHMNPQCQGQWEEGMDEVTQDWDTIYAEVDKAIASNITYQLCPRQTFVEYVGEDWDAISYLEWRWYKLQQR